MLSDNLCEHIYLVGLCEHIYLVGSLTKVGSLSMSCVVTQRGASIEARDKKGWTPLFQATYSGHQNMVQLLVSHGANVNTVYVQASLSSSSSYIILQHNIKQIKIITV